MAVTYSIASTHHLHQLCLTTVTFITEKWNGVNQQIFSNYTTPSSVTKTSPPMRCHKSCYMQWKDTAVFCIMLYFVSTRIYNCIRRRPVHYPTGHNMKISCTYAYFVWIQLNFDLKRIRFTPIFLNKMHNFLLSSYKQNTEWHIHSGCTDTRITSNDESVKAEHKILLLILGWKYLQIWYRYMSNVTRTSMDWWCPLSNQVSVSNVLRRSRTWILNWHLQMIHLFFVNFFTRYG